MPNPFFHFKQFSINQELCAMKVSTDGVILGAWVNSEQATSILDIGTGTGILALMLAQRSSAHIDAIDMEFSACRQAGENIKKSQWKDRIQIIHRTLQEHAQFNKIYDLIVSNPPYFSNSLKSTDKKRNMARHNDFLTQTELLSGVDKLLSTDGRVVLILPYTESKGFITEALSLGFYCNRILKVKPTPQKKINRMVMEFSHFDNKCEEQELIIRNEDSTFSDAYKLLTKDYYQAF